jgi:hypothetical protein
MTQKLSPIPSYSPITDKMISAEWNAYMQALYDLARVLGNNGTTANRPTSNLYVGQDYFDTTLGYKITIKSLNPTVWVDGGGTVR